MAENNISIQDDIDEAVKYFKKLGGKEGKLVRTCLRAASAGGKKKIKQNYPHVLKKRTGYLFSTIRNYVSKRKEAAYITAHRREDPVRYGFMLAHGEHILPRNKTGLLTISDGGRILARMKSVDIPEKDFIEGPGMAYLYSMQCHLDMDKAAQKQINKLETIKT